jgi:hypothetical protein
MGMVFVALERNQGRDPGYFTGVPIGFIEVAVIGQQLLGSCQVRGQRLQLPEQRGDLLLVVWCLHHLRDKHQQALRCRPRLGRCSTARSRRRPPA